MVSQSLKTEMGSRKENRSHLYERSMYGTFNVYVEKVPTVSLRCLSISANRIFLYDVIWMRPTQSFEEI